MRNFYTHPLIQGFRSTNIVNAFILNALIISGISILTVEVKLKLEDSPLAWIQDLPETAKAFSAFIISFIVALFTFAIFHILFGYGGGMLVNTH